MTKMKNLSKKRLPERRPIIFNSTRVLALCLILPAILLSQTATSSIENIEAVFIYHFTQYVKWDAPNTSRSFDIAVIGNCGIIDPMKTIAEKRIVDQKTIRIRQIAQIQDLDSAQILFIPRSEENLLDKILRQMRDRCVLVVSEIDGAVDQGAMINFVLIEGKVKFEINLQAMKKARLYPSSQLLKLATRVIE
jgi:hypothetical protein